MKLIELFSGVGTQRKAFENIYDNEIETIGISEIDQRAIKAYNVLHGETHNFGDITKIQQLPQADIWTYSFPCTDLSIAGKKKGFEGEHSSLLFQVKRLLENSPKPKILIMENVANLVSKTFIDDFNKWLDYLSSLGYTTTWKKIKAYEYGSISIRNRVFAVSILGKEKYIFPQITGTKMVVKDILEPPIEELKIDNLLLYKNNEEKNFKNSIKIADYNNGGQGNRIYSINGQGVALTATGGGKAGSSGGLYAREDGIYKLSSIEMIKIMGWNREDAIKLNNSLTRNEIGFLMGNAIDLKVMEKITEGLRGFIK